MTSQWSFSTLYLERNIFLISDSNFVRQDLQPLSDIHYIIIELHRKYLPQSLTMVDGIYLCLG